MAKKKGDLEREANTERGSSQLSEVGHVSGRNGRCFVWKNTRASSSSTKVMDEDEVERNF
jgi:hypothetical protein